MATVFRTYIDLSDLLPAALYSVLLSFFDIRVVFLSAGLWMLASPSGEVVLEDLSALDRAFPPPKAKSSLGML